MCYACGKFKRGKEGERCICKEAVLVDLSAADILGEESPELREIFGLSETVGRTQVVESVEGA